MGRDFDLPNRRGFYIHDHRAEELYLTLLDNNFSGVGFDSLELQIDANGRASDYSFTSLSEAELFFMDHRLALGDWSAGAQVVDVSYWLTASEPGAGFGFDYNLAIPETSTWAMLLAGFAGLGLVGYRRAHRAAHP